MDPNQAAMYALFKWLLDHLFDAKISIIAVPIITITLILRFIIWIRSRASGERFESLRSDYELIQEGVRNPRSYRGQMRRSPPRGRR